MKTTIRRWLQFAKWGNWGSIRYHLEGETQMTIARKRQHLLQDTATTKRHFKRYKDGKIWVFVGITTVTLGLMSFGVSAQAATADPAVVQTSLGATPAKSNTASTNSDTSSVDSTTTTVAEQTVAPATVTPSVPAASPAQTTVAPQSDSNTNPESSTSVMVPESPATMADENATTVGDDVNEAAFNALKATAAEVYQTTGTPQTITRVGAAAAVTPQTGTHGTATWDLAADGALTIHAGTMTGEATWRPYADQITSIATEAGVIADKSTNNYNASIYLFGNLPNVTTIDLTGMDTSQMTDMSHMFVDDSKLTSVTVDPTLFDTSKVTDMSQMFHGDSALVDIDLSPFDTSSVTTFYGMFQNASAIKSLDVSGFDTSQATAMQFMFDGTTSLENLDVSHFDTSKVTSMNTMFRDAGHNADAKLVLDVSNFDVAQVTDFGSMFFGSGIQVLNVKYWQMMETANTTSWLGQMDNLWQLTVGQHVKLTDSELNDVPAVGTPIPPHTSDQLGNPNLVSGIEQDGEIVTGWEMISSGTITDPEGPVWSTTQFMGFYKGNGIGAPMTYVWSQPVLNFYRPIDVATGEMVPDSETVILDTYGAVVDVNLADLAANGVIPEGYHAATGTELGSYKQPREGVGISTNGNRFNIYVAKDAAPITQGEMTVTRTIKFKSDDPSADLPVAVIQQLVYRTTTDSTTNQTGYTPTGIFAAYDVPTLPGYTADTQTVAEVVPAGTLTAPQDSVVTVTYTAHPIVYGTDTGMRRITFGSNDPKADVPGNVIQTVTYKTATDTVTGRTVSTPIGAYASYDVPELPGYTASEEVVEQLTPVPTLDAPDLWVVAIDYTANPITYGTATTTRTITFTSDNPNADLPDDVIQTVTYRTATDTVTHETVATPFGAYAGYDVPELAGYTADQTAVPQVTPLATMTTPTNTKVTVAYTAVPVDHGTATVTRTITFVDQDTGKPLAPPVVQTVPYKTTTTPVTGETVYTPNGLYGAYDVPEISGYQTSQTLVPQAVPGPTMSAPTDSVVTVGYKRVVTEGTPTETTTVTPPSTETTPPTTTLTSTTTPQTEIQTTTETTPSETVVPATEPDTTSTSDNSTATTPTSTTTAASPLTAETANSRSVASEPVVTPAPTSEATAVGKQDDATTKAAQLPQTGDQQSGKALMVAGLSALLAELGLALGLSRRKRQD